MKAILLLPTILLSVAPMFADTLIHDYQFQNTLADTLGGPSLVSQGGTLSAGEYTFGAEQGLSLSNALTTTQSTGYSIVLDFEYDDLSGFRKILDFKNLASDDGVYNLNTDLNYFNFSFGPTGAFTAGTFEEVVLTRDAATGLVVGYVNGVAQFNFTDTASDAVFNATNHIINFFEDDNVTGGRETSSGAVKEIRIYDGPLTQSEVAGLTGVPEPSTLWPLAAALFAAIEIRKRLSQRQERRTSRRQIWLN